MNSERLITKWRFWPVVCVAFIYLISNAFISLAIPLYFFQQGIPIEIISFLSSALPLTYCISPILFNKISNKLGRKKSVTIGLFGIVISQFSFYISLVPAVFLIARLSEGMFGGLIFPNLQASISDNKFEDPSRYLAIFTVSFNIGGVLGLIFAALYNFVLSDVQLVFYFSPILILVNLIITIVFFQEPLKKMVKNSVNQEDQSSTRKGSVEGVNKEFIIPVIIPMVLNVALMFAQGISTFLYPIKSEILGFEPYTAYILSFCGLTTQTIANYIINMASFNKIKYASLIALPLISLIVIAFAFNTEYIIFILLFLALGFLNGILYASAFKLFITLNMNKETSKFTSIMESSQGITYFLTLMVIGYVAGINMVLAFYILAISVLIAFLINAIFLNKFREDREDII